MQEGEPGDTVKKRHDRGTLIEMLLVRPPSLQGRTRHVKHLGRLTLGHALRFESAIAFKPLRAFNAIPALGAIFLVMLLALADCSHCYLLFKPWVWKKCMAQDGEVALLLQPFIMSRHGLPGDCHLDKWPT